MRRAEVAGLPLGLQAELGRDRVEQVDVEADDGLAVGVQELVRRVAWSRCRSGSCPSDLMSAGTIAARLASTLVDAAGAGTRVRALLRATRGKASANTASADHADDGAAGLGELHLFLLSNIRLIVRFPRSSVVPRGRHR